jgi:lactoylglutathione lyase
MTSAGTMFNHIGLCVTDLERSRRFYEGALGFRYWWEATDLPQEESGKLLQLGQPLGLRAVYLVLDDFVLELLAFHPDRLEPWRRRSMAEPGLTHISVSVSDMEATLALVPEFGGEVLDDTNLGAVAMLRDPDGQLVELVVQEWRDARPPMPA